MRSGQHLPDTGAEHLVRRIDQAWSDFLDSFAGLPDAQLTRRGTLGEWSVKDVLAHVTTWEEEALKHLPTVASGGRTRRYAAEGGIDAFNARMAAAKAHLSLAEVLRQLEETHLRLVEYVRATPTDQMAGRSRFVRRLRLDTYRHYRLHADAIRAWRQSLTPG